MLLSMVVHSSGALWELHERATEAKGFRAACLHLDSYVRSILTVFDAEGEILSSPALSYRKCVLNLEAASEIALAAELIWP